MIDGYNLLKQIIKKNIIEDKDRSAFVKQLSKYGHQKKHAIVIVFDGGQLDWPQIENSAGVLTVYSGSRQTADQYIYNYFKTENKQQEVLLVSSDSELRRLVSELGICSLDSESFYILVKRFLFYYESQKKKYHQSIESGLKDKNIVRLHGNMQHEVDSYMELAAQNIGVKKEDRLPVYDKKSIHDNGFSHKKLSRADQKLFNILKKL